MTDFATALKEQLEATPKLTRRGQRILDIINSRPSAMRTRRLAVMEAHSRSQLGIGQNMGVDWAQMDWSTILDMLLKLLLALLPFILALGDKPVKAFKKGYVPDGFST